jgi:hypothetical protein
VRPDGVVDEFVPAQQAPQGSGRFRPADDVVGLLAVGALGALDVSVELRGARAINVWRKPAAVFAFAS